MGFACRSNFLHPTEEPNAALCVRQPQAAAPRHPLRRARSWALLQMSKCRRRRRTRRRHGACPGIARAQIAQETVERVDGRDVAGNLAELRSAGSDRRGDNVERALIGPLPHLGGVPLSRNRPGPSASAPRVRRPIAARTDVGRRPQCRSAARTPSSGRHTAIQSARRHRASWLPAPAGCRMQPTSPQPLFDTMTSSATAMIVPTSESARPSRRRRWLRTSLGSSASRVPRNVASALSAL